MTDAMIASTSLRKSFGPTPVLAGGGVERIPTDGSVADARRILGGARGPDGSAPARHPARAA